MGLGSIGICQWLGGTREIFCRRFLAKGVVEGGFRFVLGCSMFRIMRSSLNTRIAVLPGLLRRCSNPEPSRA